MQLKGRPRIVLHSPGSLQLGQRSEQPGACVHGPVLSLRAPAPWPASRPDQRLLRWQEQADGQPTSLTYHPPGWQEAAAPPCWSLQIPVEQLVLAADRRGLARHLPLDVQCRLAAVTATNNNSTTTDSVTTRLLGAIAELRRLVEQGTSGEWLALEPQLLDLLVDALLASGSDPLSRPDRGWHHVIESLRCMDQGLQEELSLADLSGATGVSPRALQMAFRRHLQKRPLQSMRELRLARLRHLLLQGERHCTMAAALRRCGLPGNGTTARHYSERYGEMPSQTRI
jgi:AraC-like DNA-binding protein